MDTDADLGLSVSGSPNVAQRQMKVLVACESSGRVRDAFLALGHNAISCDLLPTDAPGPHHQGDVREILNQGWDILIAFPTCTYLCSSGMHRTIRGLRDPQLTEDALGFVRLLLDAPIPHISLENPVGCISTRIRKPDCIIQPWQFGHPESKTTCLWLKNLPALQPTNICQKPTSGRWENQTPSGQNKLGPSPTRWKERSKTYPGIAEAMAKQWSEYVLSLPANCPNAITVGNRGVQFTLDITEIAPVSDQVTPKMKDTNSPKKTESSTQYVLCEPDPATLMMALSRR